MPSPKKKAPTKGPSPKELQQKCTELTELTDKLTVENAELKLKFKMICEKIASHSDIKHYGYESSLDAENFDIQDLIHMIQVFVLKAAKLKTAEILDNHFDGFERRILELTSGDSDLPLREKFKLQERIEFIKQERDVWKRNAETFKQMYTKLAKEKETNQTLSQLQVQSIKVISLQPTQPEIKRASSFNSRPITAVCCRTCKIRGQQPLAELDQNSLQTINSSVEEVHSTQNNLFQTFNTESIEITDYEALQRERMEPPIIKNMTRKRFEGIPSELQAVSSGLQKRLSVDSSNMSSEGKPMNSTRKNVSFNKEIDVGIFRKDSKNLKLIDSYLQPLPMQNVQLLNDQIKQQQKQQEQQLQQQQQQNFQIFPSSNESTTTNEKRSEPPIIQKNETISQQTPIHVRDHIRNILICRSDLDSVNSLFSIVNNRRTSSPFSTTTTSSDNPKYTNRASICSIRKFPGETPVKDLEPTLKMIIIKELSMEKNDGNDWRMFAKRVGISEKEIKEWEALKLQYPMARVLSIWSSRQNATTRILYRHLNAPGFNYSVLAKRIENFYDVL